MLNAHRVVEITPGFLLEVVLDGAKATMSLLEIIRSRHSKKKEGFWTISLFFFCVLYALPLLRSVQARCNTYAAMLITLFLEWTRILMASFVVCEPVFPLRVDTHQPADVGFIFQRFIKSNK